MERKKLRLPYEAPTVEVALTDCLDIITSSTALGGNPNDSGYDSDGWT